MAEERGDIRGIVPVAFVTGAADPDPGAGVLAADSDTGRGPCVGQQRRDLGIKHPPAGADGTRVGSLLKQELDHLPAAAFGRSAEGAASRSDGLGGLIEQCAQGRQLITGRRVVDRRDVDCSPP
jgi:hypothetical protein